MRPVTAGEPVLGAWCPVCLAPTRLRVPLLQDGRDAGTLEVCPGCGTGHDRPSVAVTPPPGRLHGNPLAAVARALHRRACRRLPALACAHGDCPWPGLWRHAHEMTGDEGTWRYVFCSRRHRRAWAAANQVVLS